MTEIYTCPYCRSKIELKKLIDYTVPYLQTLYCPVCNFEWWLPSYKGSSIFPFRYSISRIVERNEPRKVLETTTTKIPEELSKPVYEDLKEITMGTVDKLKIILFVVLAILILLFLIRK